MLIILFKPSVINLTPAELFDKFFHLNFNLLKDSLTVGSIINWLFY